jgi:hypothetical protein
MKKLKSKNDSGSENQINLLNYPTAGELESKYQDHFEHISKSVSAVLKIIVETGPWRQMPLLTWPSISTISMSTAERSGLAPLLTTPAIIHKKRGI